MFAGVREYDVIVQVAGPRVGLRNGHRNYAPQAPSVAGFHQETAAAVAVTRAGSISKS